VTDDHMSVVSYDWDHDVWAGVFDKRIPIKKL